MTHRSILVNTSKCEFFHIFEKTLVTESPKFLIIFATVSIKFPPLSINKSLNNARLFCKTPVFFRTSHFSRFNSFFSLFCFFPAFVLHCFRRPPPHDQVIFYLLGNPYQSINQFIWIWSFLPTPSFRAEEQECWHAGGWKRLRECPWIRYSASSRKRHGNGHAKPEPGYECQSGRTFENFSSNAQLRGAFSSTFTRFSLARPFQSY